MVVRTVSIPRFSTSYDCRPMTWIPGACRMHRPFIDSMAACLWSLQQQHQPIVPAKMTQLTAAINACKVKPHLKMQGVVARLQGL